MIEVSPSPGQGWPFSSLIRINEVVPGSAEYVDDFVTGWSCFALLSETHSMRRRHDSLRVRLERPIAFADVSENALARATEVLKSAVSTGIAGDL